MLLPSLPNIRMILPLLTNSLIRSIVFDLTFLLISGKIEYLS